jgi:large subunit ribosomal protein L29
VRTRELRGLSDDDLAKKLAEQREELFNLRFQDATGALDNTARLKQTKREIARILTLQGERARGLERR